MHMPAGPCGEKLHTKDMHAHLQKGDLVISKDCSLAAHGVEPAALGLAYMQFIVLQRTGMRPTGMSSLCQQILGNGGH